MEVRAAMSEGMGGIEWERGEVAIAADGAPILTVVKGT